MDIGKGVWDCYVEVGVSVTPGAFFLAEFLGIGRVLPRLAGDDEDGVWLDS